MSALWRNPWCLCCSVTLPDGGGGWVSAHRHPVLSLSDLLGPVWMQPCYPRHMAGIHHGHYPVFYTQLTRGKKRGNITTNANSHGPTHNCALLQDTGASSISEHTWWEANSHKGQQSNCDTADFKVSLSLYPQPSTIEVNETFWCLENQNVTWKMFRVPHYCGLGIFTLWGVAPQLGGQAWGEDTVWGERNKQVRVLKTTGRSFFVMWPIDAACFSAQPQLTLQLWLWLGLWHTAHGGD